MARVSLLLVAALLFFPGCKKMEDLAKGGPSGSGASGGGGENPNAAIDAYRDAIKKQDFAKLYDLMSADFQTRQLAKVEQLKKNLAGGNEAEKKAATETASAAGLAPEDFQKLDARSLAVRVFAADVKAHPEKFPPSIKATKAIKLDGDRAEVTYVTEADIAGVLRFLKQNGTWRITD